MQKPFYKKPGGYTSGSGGYSGQPRPVFGQPGYVPFNRHNRTIINEGIRAFELRILGDNGENLGVMSRNEALAKAKSEGKDLILVSETANPQVAKIADYGKYSYLEDKKKKEKKHTSDGATETKVLRISISTGEGDLSVKAKQASEWLSEGHRIKLELQLKGRSNALDHNFLAERLKRILILLTENYKIAEPIKKSPGSMTMVLEKGAKRREVEVI